MQCIYPSLTCNSILGCEDVCYWHKKLNSSCDYYFLSAQLVLKTKNMQFAFKSEFSVTTSERGHDSAWVFRDEKRMHVFVYCCRLFIVALISQNLSILESVGLLCYCFNRLVFSIIFLISKGSWNEFKGTWLWKSCLSGRTPKVACFWAVFFGQMAFGVGSIFSTKNPGKETNF